jgi:adenylate cyclase
MKIRLEAIRTCLDGGVPGNIATASPDGTPNIAYFSQMQYVDPEHVALSYQFFNTTRRNILGSPFARVSVVDPVTAAQYRLSLQYLRTESEGPVFETMKAKLAGIASHTGMSGVFRLLGSDVYRVLDIERVPGVALPPPPVRRDLLASLRSCAEALHRHADLDSLLTGVLGCLEAQFDVQHAMVLMLEPGSDKLYTVASRGYDCSGAGAEIPLGHGVIGVAAREGTPIRIGHFTAEYSYGRAIRESLRRSGEADRIETEIPLPGLAQAGSQLAVPIRAGARILGVLYMESAQDQRFGYDDEDAIVTLAGQLGMAMQLAQLADAEEPAAAAADAGGLPGPAVVVRHYTQNDSIFLDDDYLIKGVAGSIFCALVRDYLERGRVSFSNRELRLDTRVRLPDLSDNLEARLILLSRRLEERAACVRIVKTGRGRFELRVCRRLQLVEVG